MDKVTEKGYITGNYEISLRWFVKRKEIYINSSGNNYRKTFYIDKDFASGAIFDHTISFDTDPLFVQEIEKGDEPVVSRTYYENYDDNEAIARDAALFKVGFTNGHVLAAGHTNLSSINLSTNFIFGPSEKISVKMVQEDYDDQKKDYDNRIIDCRFWV